MLKNINKYYSNLVDINNDVSANNGNSSDLI